VQQQRVRAGGRPPAARRPHAHAPPLPPLSPPPFASRRARKRRQEEEHSDDGEHEGYTLDELLDHEEYTKTKNVEVIELGRYEMDTWYFSPLPRPEFDGAKKLYFCEYDLEFFTRREHMLRRLRKARLQHPPGAEIYRHRGVSMFEVDGTKAKQYCQNLCYLAKMFLDHKSLRWDTDHFLFYVMCECDERGAHIVGYFSKEKHSEEGCNLACILTLPSYQRRGYGKFLISFSYELSKLEGKAGTPERPLSDLGAVSYRGYWTRVLLALLRDLPGPVSIKELSEMTRIKLEDITATLTALSMIQYQKGQHVICAAPHVIAAHLAACGSPGLVVDPTKIVWTPIDTRKE
jgi:histone acetyltransferase MYST1